MKIFKNKWGDILLIIFILALIIPQTRKPIQIFVNKVISFAPSVNDEDEWEKIADYNWILQDINGRRVEFSDFKDEVVIVNFWATWCPPCLAEMPDFQKLYEDYGGKAKFFFVTNEQHETVLTFLRKKRYTLPTYKMLTKAPGPMDGRTLPTTYVLDKKGNIVVDKVGAANWNSDSFRKTLDKLLGQ
ncbi:thiol-disulfide oxidoreductase [Christiangramia fulva]|uniref:Thiol-disulfide oxidoreductase n=1 Tax=Christiangramia fulva TaxID=2126553 RepID=A0A2R3Z0Y9_9FLAO|nr:TlpA disulfide reductase family protein [Christiangramia fulva]AVR43930.1 thiol-disulfide oxidoreductase [Christiangramia fulva]